MSTIGTQYAKCNRCGWVHFEVTREDAEGCVERGGSMDSYEYCFRCGNNYRDFSDSDGSEVPSGSTVQPIIRRSRIKAVFTNVKKPGIY